MIEMSLKIIDHYITHSGITYMYSIIVCCLAKADSVHLLCNPDPNRKIHVL